MLIGTSLTLVVDAAEHARSWQQNQEHSVVVEFQAMGMDILLTMFLQSTG